MIELQCHNQSKVNPRWWMKLKIERALSWITSGSKLCNWVSQFLQNCFTPFSSSQSGKANDESAVRYIKHADWGETRCVFCFFASIICFAIFFLCQGREAPLATLWNCTIVYLIIETNATHMQARTIITVLDFLLAQNTPPVALWACRRRFFAPRDSAVRKSANETLSGSRLSEHEVRVKAA